MPGVEGVGVDSGRVRQVGPYRLLKKLGQGGMSNVFLSEDESGNQVAVKLLNLSLEMDPQFRKRFQREAEITQQLDHPSIVKTLSWRDDPDVGVYLVMEYVAGGNLRRLLEDLGERRLEVFRILTWFEPICQALDYAHQHGVVHRDIKPENLLFASEDTLKIADFGVARIESGSRLTRTGVLPGTPEYMAPEQFSDQVAGPTADIYSLATVVYETLTGTTPFRSDNLAQVLQRQAFEKPQAPSEYRGDLPAYLDKVLLKALEKKPEQRFTSAGDFFRALAQPPSISLAARNSGSASSHDLPTRQVLWRDTLTRSVKAPPWEWALVVFTLAALLWVWRWFPSPTPPDWLEHGVGWQPVPLGRQLCCSVLWNGIEIALVGPNQTQSALAQGRFAAAQLSLWFQEPPKGKQRLQGKSDGQDYVLYGEEEWLRIDPQMGANLRAEPKHAGEYWLALMEDLDQMRSGQSPTNLKELERKRPLRLDRSAPRYPLFDKLFQRSRFLQRQGPLSTEVILGALESLTVKERKDLVEAARSIPMAAP